MNCVFMKEILKIVNQRARGNLNEKMDLKFTKEDLKKKNLMERDIELLKTKNILGIQIQQKINLHSQVLKMD